MAAKRANEAGDNRADDRRQQRGRRTAQDRLPPLIMSFSAEQKREVRALAHVVGLEQLLSEF